MLCTRRCVPTEFSLLVIYKLAQGGVHAIQVVINKINYNSYLEASIKLNIPLTSLKRKIKNKELC